MNSDSVAPGRLGHRVGRALTRFLVLLLVLALLGAVGFLLSQLNARTFTLQLSQGSITVFKGRLLPAGSQPYRPPDPSLADAYAPLPIDGESIDPALLNQRFTERDELDRALFEIVQKLAQPRVIADDPSQLERGLYYLRRAERLSGITGEQKATLKRMQADVAYYQARLKLDEARKLVGEALLQLHSAAETPNRHARSANRMIITIEAPARSLEEALRNAVHSLSAPAQEGQVAPPVPAPPSAPAAPPPQVTRDEPAASAPPSNEPKP